ncbi:hypothetical protein ACVIIV_003172 [Bradyrhizobium sp. USDA 4354]
MIRIGCSSCNLLRDLGDRLRFDIAVGYRKDAGTSAHGETGADCLQRLRRTNEDHRTSVVLPAFFRRSASSIAISLNGSLTPCVGEFNA